jgi:hypothetical protein
MWPDFFEKAILNQFELKIKNLNIMKLDES